MLSQIDIFVAGLRSSMRHFSVFNQNKNKLSLVQLKRFTCCAVVQTRNLSKISIFIFDIKIFVPKWVTWLLRALLKCKRCKFYNRNDFDWSVNVWVLSMYFILIWKLSTNLKIHTLRIFQELCSLLSNSKCFLLKITIMNVTSFL